MISPKAIQLIIKHFDSIDEAVARRLTRRRPWGEPALTSLLCDLLDSKTQEEEKLRYSLVELNRDLMEMDGLLSISFTIDTHEYDSKMERWVTQADLGLIIKFEDEIIPSDSWTTAWLLQAKRLYPSKKNPIEYSEVSRFPAKDNYQHDRMKKLEEIIGLSFICYILYCPRPAMLDDATSIKLTHLRNRQSAEHIFDFTLGLQLHEELSSRNSSLSAGVFVTTSSNMPANLGHVHAGLLRDCFPFSWFIASHFINQGLRFETINRRYLERNIERRPRKGLGPEPKDNNGYEWAEGIVSGDEKAIERLLELLNESDISQFPILPPHTLTIKIGVGGNLNSNVRRLRHE